MIPVPRHHKNTHGPMEEQRNKTKPMEYRRKQGKAKDISKKPKDHQTKYQDYQRNQGKNQGMTKKPRKKTKKYQRNEHPVIPKETHKLNVGSNAQQFPHTYSIVDDVTNDILISSSPSSSSIDLHSEAMATSSTTVISCGEMPDVILGEVTSQIPISLMLQSCSNPMFHGSFPYINSYKFPMA